MVKEVELLKYKGVLNFEQIGVILDKVQPELDNYSSDTLVKKRIYSVLVEVLENVHNHGYNNQEYLPQCILTRYDDNFVIKISNVVLNANIEKFKNILDYVNSLSEDEINKSFYGKIKEKTILEESEAGVGIIQIAKKASSKLVYNFKTINDKISYFTLKVTI